MPVTTEDELRTQLRDARDEAAALRSALDGDKDSAVLRLYWKVQRQRQELHILNAKLARRRFALRIMNRLREPVTAEEWKQARGEILSAESHRELVGDKLPLPDEK